MAFPWSVIPPNSIQNGILIIEGNGLGDPCSVCLFPFPFLTVIQLLFFLYLGCDHLLITPLYHLLNLPNDPEFIQLQLQFPNAVCEDLELGALPQVKSEGTPAVTLTSHILQEEH
eukprot:g12341.t1